ncbi:MAG TPA: T9SS type A sorting domain-containing protein [Bacteroidetes bacterium]|nr:flagellar basal body rod modification protein [bacterium BMS3Bbin04]HDO66167.1 T9SS type A sorting domain-containing protein [Bacteroidota bacterium]HEX05292.1 T9SS type A sorting domain-containing protein [Bacteroidota bacterium]
MRSLFSILFVLTFSCLSIAQLWTSHELPASANTGGYGTFIIFDYDDDSDGDVVALSQDLRIMTNNLPDEWSLWNSGIFQEFGTMYDGELHDMDLDGDQDVICYAGSELPWLENLGGFEFEVHVIAELEESRHWNTISCGDIDNDGDIDIVLTQTSTGSASYGLSFWMQENDGTFTETVMGATNGYGSLSQLADLNGDGNLDFLIREANAQNNSLISALGDGDGNFTLQELIPDLDVSYSTEPKLGDFDFDGDLDFVFYHGEGIYVGEKVLWGQNDGAGNFTVHVVENNLDPSDKAVEMLDCDNDGDMDIAYGPYLYINEGDNLTFTETLYTDIDPGYIFDRLVAADIDNDGDMDLLNEEVRWFENPTIDLAVNEDHDGSALPSSFALHPAYPNPFNASTTLQLSLPHAVEVTVSVYNVMGQQVATLADGPMPAGVHPLTWDTSAAGNPSLTSGLYFIRASVGDTRSGQLPDRATHQVQKVMLVR